MANLNSKTEFFEGKKTFDYNTHYRMPKIKLSKKRRRTTYKGVTNQEPVKPKIL
jgi:hypothetical protein